MQTDNYRQPPWLTWPAGVPAPAAGSIHCHQSKPHTPGHHQTAAAAAPSCLQSGRGRPPPAARVSASTATATRATRWVVMKVKFWADPMDCGMRIACCKRRYPPGLHSAEASLLGLLVVKTLVGSPASVYKTLHRLRIQGMCFPASAAYPRPRLRVKPSVSAALLIVMRSARERAGAQTNHSWDSDEL